MLIDTHCHIHLPDYAFPAELVLARAKEVGVEQMICVGTSADDSKLAIDFAAKYPKVFASVGLHPHEAKNLEIEQDKLASLAKQNKVVAIGECGLDYYYLHSPKVDQKKALSKQIEIAQDNNLPMIFHVRDAFADFWQIFDSHNSFKKPIRGVIHSFTAGIDEVEQALERGLYFGLNGIMTFTKDQNQLEAVRNIPINNIMLETDSPFLTPAPYRGKVCEPRYVDVIASFLADLREEDTSLFKKATTKNANALFNLVRES